MVVGSNRWSFWGLHQHSVDHPKPCCHPITPHSGPTDLEPATRVRIDVNRIHGRDPERRPPRDVLIQLQLLLLLLQLLLHRRLDGGGGLQRQQPRDGGGEDDGSDGAAGHLSYDDACV